MSVINELRAEWTVLASSTTLTQRLGRWSQDESALSEVRDGHRLLECTEDRSNPDRADGILACLVKWAAADNGNDRLAERCVLQIMLPGATRLAASTATRTGVDLADADATTLTILTERIRSFPWRERTCRVAAYLMGEVRWRLRRELVQPHMQQRTWEQTADHEELVRLAEGRGPLWPSMTSVLLSRTLAGVELRHLMAWSARQRGVTPANMRVILLSRVAGVPVKELAAAEDIPVHSLRRRRQRGEQQLAAASA